MTTILVPVKAVPLTAGRATLTSARTWREADQWQLDPINETTLEWAVARREAGEADVVVGVTVGPTDRGLVALRAAHSRGATALVQVATDVQLDMPSTARLLAATARRVGATLVAFGYESYDGSSGTLPAATAAALGWPVATRVRDATVADGELTATRSLATRTTTVSIALPSVASFVEGAIVPRHPPLSAAIAARRASPTVVAATELVAPEQLASWTTGLEAVEPVPARAHATRVLDLDAGVLAIAGLARGVRGESLVEHA